jgi:hypothetical protein
MMIEEVGSMYVRGANVRNSHVVSGRNANLLDFMRFLDTRMSKHYRIVTLFSAGTTTFMFFLDTAA